ncbi:MAG: hypothetical protein ABJO88_00255 [Parasphingorhabdus sp.]
MKALIWITLGPLVLGFLSPVFWTEHSEFSEKQKRILELISGQDYLTSFFPPHENLKKPLIADQNSDCRLIASSILSITASATALKPQREELTDLYYAARMAEASYIKQHTTELRSELLSPLPSPVIGMLDACIHATLLSPLCEAGLKAKLNSISTAEINKIQEASLKQVQPMWCMTSEKMLSQSGIDPKTIRSVPSTVR